MAMKRLFPSPIRGLFFYLDNYEDSTFYPEFPSPIRGLFFIEKKQCTQHRFLREFPSPIRGLFFIENGFEINN